jgi:protein-S-isoprenylcysteine O-methyltransferase Ste14
MTDTSDTAQVIVRPPIAWGLSAIAGVVLNCLKPLPFLPIYPPPGSVGAIVFVLALALGAWAVVTMTRAGSNVPTHLPTTTVVESGPYRYTRNPDLCRDDSQPDTLAIAFNNLCMLIILVPFALVIRYGMVAREGSLSGAQIPGCVSHLQLACPTLAVRT